MHDELICLLSTLVAVFFGTALLVSCSGKKKPNGKTRSPAPSNSAKSPAPGVPTFNHGVCVMYEGKADMKQHTKTISEVEPEDSKSGEEEKEDDGNAAKKPDKMKFVNVGINETQADFAVKLLQHASHDNKDASLYAGAKADTKAQLGKLIANGASDEEIHKHFSSVVEELSAEHAKCKLESLYKCKVESANRVYAQQGFTVLDKFKADIKRYYGGLFQQVNFKQRAKAAKEINDFVVAKTHQRIKNVITPDVLNELSRLVLVNAIYFKGTWEAKFRRERTMKRIFYVAKANEPQVDMMYQTSQFIYFDDEDAQVLGMPYEGEDFFMFVILPRKRYGLQDVLGSLNGKKLAVVDH